MGRKMSDQADGARVSEQAAHWWVVLDGEDVSAAEQREFGEWIARSPERVEAYLRTTILMRALEARGLRWPDVSAEVLISEAASAPPEPQAISPEARSVPLRTNSTKTMRRKLLPVALAASFVAVVIATSLLVTGSERYRTAQGEQRSVVLDDGSVVTLNTASRVEVDLSKSRRLVRLTEGEALFDVAHDAARPFDVETGGATIRAVGTRFNVDSRSTGTTITVVEGQVAVIPRDAAAGSSRGAVGSPARRGDTADAPSGSAQKPIMLAAAQRLTINDSRLGQPETVANLAAATVWVQRQLIFDRRPLAEVAAEFNRYNRDAIVIEDEKLRNEQVTGVFQANDTASFVTFLTQIPGVRTRRTADALHVVVGDAGAAAEVTDGQ